MTKFYKLRMNMSAIMILAIVAQFTGIQVLLASSGNEMQNQATLTVRNNNTVLLNGQKATTGDSVSSGAQIETMSGAEAEVQFPQVGTLKIFQKTALNVTFGAERIDVKVERGCASLFLEKGNSGTLLSPDNKIKTSQSGSADELNSCANDPQSPNMIGGLPLGVFLSLVIGGSVAAAIIVGTKIGDEEDASRFRP